MSDTWIMPSMPSSISTNAPYAVMLRTWPFTMVPGGYFFSISSHGFTSS